MNMKEALAAAIKAAAVKAIAAGTIKEGDLPESCSVRWDVTVSM